METTLKILLVNNKANVSKQFTTIVSQTNFMLRIVENSNSAISIFESFHPHIVFCDSSQACQDLFNYIRATSPQCIINMIIERNDNKLIVNAMKYGISNYLVPPLNDSDIKTYLKQCECVLNRRKKIETQNAIAQQKTLSFSTNNSLDNVAELVETLLSHVNPCFKECDCELRLGLAELIINAIEHGNLQISYEEKTTALHNCTFENLLKERQEDERFKNRTVSIEFHQEPTFDEWFIKDDGDGFDYTEITTIFDNSNIEQLHGRGIFLSRFQFDEIEYSEHGTKVRLRRYVPIYY